MPRPAEREAFLAGVHVGVLSVAEEADRAPLAIPVWYLYEPGGDIALITARDSRKMELVRKAGRVSLVAQDREPPYRYASVEGPVVAVQDPARPEDRRTLAIAGAPRDSVRPASVGGDLGDGRRAAEAR
jgi:nitroimidazol reductase NimA-like FMN-containing flavoprotein (pyridoxamine 5'-phosphate oxidase superfamily)